MSCDNKSEKVDDNNNSIEKTMQDTRSLTSNNYTPSEISLKYSGNIYTYLEDTSTIYTSIKRQNIGQIVKEDLKQIAGRNTSSINKDITKSNIALPFYNEPNNNNPLRLISVVFDNDIFNNTDYYYTNGVKISFISPSASNTPLNRILIGKKNADIDLYGFILKQNIYTPTNPDIEDISFGDRPFSAFLTIGQIRNSYDISNRLAIKSNINVGVLGPASLGGAVQSSIHNIEPIGWNNQIQNNIVVDYAVEIEKGIISNNNLELNLIAGANIGTLFNNAYGGAYFRFGNFTPVYRNILPAKSNDKRSKFQYWFFISGSTTIVGYDATLQGGLFNRKSQYTLGNNEINRLVARASAGLAIYYKSIGVELQNHYLSPEFKNAYDFRWGRIKITVRI